METPLLHKFPIHIEERICKKGTYKQLSKNNNQYRSKYRTLQKLILFKHFLHSALH